MKTGFVRLTTLLVLVAILSVAFALRVFSLDFHALWWDEGLTLYFSRLGPSESVRMAAMTEEINPPIFRWAIGLWSLVAGPSVFAARIVNVLCGVLIVALTYRLGRLVAERKVAALGGMLVAVSPMYVYYAREVKGYVFASSALLAGFWVWLRMELSDRCRTCDPHRHGLVMWTVYALSVLLAVGGNYLTVLMLVTEDVASFVLALVSYRGIGKWSVALRRMLYWVSAQMVGILPMLFFILGTLRSTSRGLIHTSSSTLYLSPQSLHVYLMEVLVGFAEGTFTESARGMYVVGVPTLAAFLPAVLGVAAPIWLRTKVGEARISGVVVVAIWLLGPVALGFLFQLMFAWFFPRFLLYAGVAFWLLVGAGMAYLSSTVRRVWARLPIAVVLFAAIVIPWGSTLYAHYVTPSDPDEDWRPLADDLAGFVRPDDLIIYDYTWMVGYLYCYMPQVSEMDRVLGFFNVDRLDEELEPLFERYERVWMLNYLVGLDDPANLAGNWFRERAGIALDRWYGNAHVALAVTRSDFDGERMVERFDYGIVLRYPAPRATETLPGDVLMPVLEWEVEAPIEPDSLVVYMHLLDEEAGVLVAQNDGAPANGLAPFHEWRPGELVIDRRALLIPPDAVPGEYVLRVGVYDWRSGDRLLTESGGDGVDIGHVTVMVR